MEFYNYDRNGTAYELAPPARHGLWRSRGLAYPTAVASEMVRTPAAGEYYAPRARCPAPLAVIAHGMGDTSLVPARLLAGALQGAGWACYVPHLPILAARTPQMAHPATCGRRTGPTSTAFPWWRCARRWTGRRGGASWTTRARPSWA